MPSHDDYIEECNKLKWIKHQLGYDLLEVRQISERVDVIRRRLAPAFGIVVNLAYPDDRCPQWMADARINNKLVEIMENRDA